MIVRGLPKKETTGPPEAFVPVFQADGLREDPVVFR